MNLNRKILRKMILKEMAEMQGAFSYNINVLSEYGDTIVYVEMKAGAEDCDIAFQTPLQITDQDLAHIFEGGLGEELEHNHHIDATETSANANEFLVKHQSLIAPQIQYIVSDLMNLDLEEPDDLGFYPDDY